MINTYAYLCEHFNQFSVFNNISPTYVQTLTGVGPDKVIFIYKQGKTIQRELSEIKIEFCESPSKVNLEETKELISLESPQGSPLKDDCEIEVIKDTNIKVTIFNSWDEIEEQYDGIPVDEARHLLNQLQEFKPFGNDNNGSIFILTNGRDDEKTLLLELFIEKEWFTRGVVQLKGTTTIKEMNMLKYREVAHKMIPNPLETDAKVETYYTFMNNTTLKFTHSGSNGVKQSSFMQSNQCTLFQILNINENISIANEFLMEIFKLNELFNDIVRFKEEYDPSDIHEPQYKRNSGIIMETLNNQIMKILCTLPDPEPDIKIKTKSPLEMSIEQAKHRRLCDVTDQLWEVLKYCGNFKDLKNGLQMIFNVSAKCNIVNMPIRSTKLGELINDISEQRIAKPVLINAQPLELLLEIGLEKISRDYDHIFSESRICNAGDLKVNKKSRTKTRETMSVRKSLYNAAAKVNADIQQRKTLLHGDISRLSITDESNAGFQNSRFNEQDIQEKLERLLQIHLILEHLLLIQVNLGVDTVHSFVTQSLLKEDPIKFKKVLKQRLNKLELTITDDKLKNLTENKLPSAKRISIIAEDKLRKLKMVHYFSTNSIFPTPIFGDIFDSSTTIDQKDKDEINYWHISYTKIGTRRSK